MKQITVYVRDSDSPYTFDIALEKSVMGSMHAHASIFIQDPDSNDSVFIPFHAVTSVEIGDVDE